jgi:hypothetical protein
LLTRDSAATDPVCSLSAQRGIVDAILRDVNGVSKANPETTPKPELEWLYRPNPA